MQRHKTKIIFLAIIFFSLFGLAESSRAAYPVAGRKKFLPLGFIFAFLIVFLSLAPTSTAYGADHYVRQGAAGANNGSDWTNAYTSLPSSLVRGNTYYIADGTYGGRTLNTTNSGTATITIMKATALNHGTDSGWSSTYGDGQAAFGDILLGSDYWVIDGQTRNESNWASGTSYGIKVTTIEANTSIFPGVCASNITIRYVNAGGAEGTSYTGSEPGFAFKVSGFDERCTNWTISRSYAHNIAHYATFHMNGLDGYNFEYNYISNGFGKEAIRGQIALKNGSIKYNKFYNACGATGVSGEGCTAEIAIWDGNSSGFDGNKIYGNWFYRTRDENSGGTIVVGGNGTSWAGPSASNTLIYNNTIAGVSGSGVGGLILVNGSSGNICRNNLWYDAAGWGVSCGTKSNNTSTASDPFVNYAGGDLHLSAGIAGYVLSSPYNGDMEGIMRGSDGAFDIGAYEYIGGSSDTTPPTAPQGLSVS